MTWRSVLSVLILAMSLPLAACASKSSSTQPAASVPQTHPAWLTGTWQASGWQVGAAQTQFERETMVTFAPDGSWKTTAGGSGTSWLEGDRVLIQGRTADGQPIKYTLRQRQSASGPELWGTVAAREGNVEISLRKAK
jgi:hypothetical protein